MTQMSLGLSSPQPSAQFGKSTEAYYALERLHEAGRLTNDEWQSYQALWHYGPADVKSITGNLVHWGNLRPKVNRALSSLRKKGLVEQQPDKRSWAVTARVEPLDVPRAAKKPSKKKFAKGVEDVEMALIRAEAVGLRSPEAVAVLDWLKSKL